MINIINIIINLNKQLNKQSLYMFRNTVKLLWSRINI